MTITEEQREAIKYAISSLEQCGSEPEDPVVAKILGAMIDSSEDADYESLRCENCGKTLKEIRGSKYAGDYRLGEIHIDPGQEASISDPPIEPSYYFWCDECKNDSSDQFSEVTKLIPGFDLERVKADLGDIGDPRFCDCEVRTQLAAAIDEIERQRANVIAANHSELDLQLRIKELEADLEQAERVIEARLEVIDQQAARIKSLKKEIRRLKHESKVEQEFTNSYIKHLHEAEARIKELEDALSEYQRLGKTIAGRVPCLVPHGDCGRCSADPREVCGALEQIAEGKIGPDAKPRSWQITDERKATLSASLKVLERLKKNNTDTDHSYLDRGITVLRDMLEEAE